MVTQSPPPKRVKLESSPEPVLDAEAYKPEEPPLDDDLGEDHCTICLQPISDRTVLPACSHEFCFDCILIWTEQSRKCPLCARQIGEYLIHNIRSKYDYQKHYLAPLRTSPRPDVPLVRAQAAQRRRTREVEWGRNQRRERERERRAADELERAIEKRRWVYRHNLYAKHVASNSYTRYRPFPTPQQFSSNPDMVSRATVFIRRELRVWDALDVEFLTTFTISLMKSLDIRSEPAVKLLAEFLDMDSDGLRTNAEHFAHELYSYLRSPYRDLNVYDSVVQYDTPEDLSPPRRQERSRRWATESPSPRASRSPSPGPSRTRPRADTRQASRSASPRAWDDDARSRPPESPASRGKPRSRTRSASRPRSGADRDPQPDGGPARGTGGGHARDAKGKRRAGAAGGGREAGTYTRSRRADGPDARAAKGPAAVEGGRGSGAAPVDQSARALDGAPPAAAGLVGPGGLPDGSPPAAARDAAPAHARDIKTERPRVGRGAWQSLNSYLAGASADERGGHEARRRETRKAEPVELSIRGAARQRAASSAGASSTPAPSDPPAHEEDIHLAGASSAPRSPNTPAHEADSSLARTATGTPALLARTPDADAAGAAATAQERDVTARVRARLAQLKQELPAEGAPSPPSPPPPISAGPPASPRPAAAQLAMPVATAGAGGEGAAALRARLRDRLARERAGAHMRDQREARPHGDASHRARGAAALDAAGLEARLRAQARARVVAHEARDVASGVATDADEGDAGGGGDLRTREEVLRARLKRGR